MPDQRKWSELKPKEINERKQLTELDYLSIQAIVANIQNLSPFICMEIDETGLTIQKRITNGYAVPVARVRKKSLCFDNDV